MFLDGTGLSRAIQGVSWQRSPWRSWSGLRLENLSFAYHPLRVSLGMSGARETTTLMQLALSSRSAGRGIHRSVPWDYELA